MDEEDYSYLKIPELDIIEIKVASHMTRIVEIESMFHVRNFDKVLKLVRDKKHFKKSIKINCGLRLLRKTKSYGFPRYWNYREVDLYDEIVLYLITFEYCDCKSHDTYLTRNRRGELSLVCNSCKKVEKIHLYGADAQLLIIDAEFEGNV